MGISKMKYLKTYEAFNNFTLTIEDLDNIHLLWRNNKFKSIGIKYYSNLEHLVQAGLLIKDDNNVLSTPELDKLIKKQFLGKTIFDCINICYQLANSGVEKELAKLPIEVFLDFHDTLDNRLYKIRNKKTDIINHGFRDNIIEKVLKSTGLKEYNYYELFKLFFPNPIPTTFKLFRGIKSLPDEKHNRIYSSWTDDYSQAERFSKWHFTTYSWEKPREANKQSILETEVPLEKIQIYIGGMESEYILKNDEIKYTYKIIKNKKEIWE